MAAPRRSKARRTRTGKAVTACRARCAGPASSSPKWIDAHEKELGIGRPYLDRDPPHVGPTDGKEYSDKRGVTKSKLAGLATNRRATRIALADNRGTATRRATK